MQQTQQSWESETWGVDLQQCPLSEQDALGNSELLARAGLEGEQCEPDELDLDAHLGLLGILGLACSSAGPTEEERQIIVERWGEDVLKDWIELGAREAWKKCKTLREIGEKSADVLLGVDDATDFLAAADALARTETNDPVGSIEAIADFLYLSSSFFPNPGVSVFLKCTAVVVEQIAGQLGGVVERNQRMNEIAAAPLFPGVTKEGRAIVGHLMRVRASREPVTVVANLCTYAARHSEELGRITGEPPPVWERDLLGVDVLAPDKRDYPALEQWFLRHVDVLYDFYVAPLYPDQG